MCAASRVALGRCRRIVGAVVERRPPRQVAQPDPAPRPRSRGPAARPPVRSAGRRRRAPPATPRGSRAGPRGRRRRPRTCVGAQARSASASSLAMAWRISSVARRHAVPARRDRGRGRSPPPGWRRRGHRATRANRSSVSVGVGPHRGAVGATTRVPGAAPRPPSATWFCTGRPVVVNANPHVLVVIARPCVAGSLDSASRFLMPWCRHLEGHVFIQVDTMPAKSRGSSRRPRRSGAAPRRPAPIVPGASRPSRRSRSRTAGRRSRAHPAGQPGTTGRPVETPATAPARTRAETARRPEGHGVEGPARAKAGGRRSRWSPGDRIARPARRGCLAARRRRRGRRLRPG